MKSHQNILVAFLLNLSFALFETIGGILTGSVAILSDSVHDLGDAVSIGVSYLLERMSKKQPNDRYTYGYLRYSTLGGFITTAILIIGSAIMIINAMKRIITPTIPDYNKMILLAIIGVCVNFCAAAFTRKGDSINQKAVNLHMLEDVFGWLVVLIGSIVMRFTNFSLLDPILSIAVSFFILIHALKNLKEILDVFLEKEPNHVNTPELINRLEQIDGVLTIHHLHLWSLDSVNHCATLHVVTDDDSHKTKEAIRQKLQEHGIHHVTIEIESSEETCHHAECTSEWLKSPSTRHHHHH